MDYVVLDAETNIRNSGDGAIGGMAASPFLKENGIVAMGELTKDGEYFVEYSAEPGGVSQDNLRASAALQRAANNEDVLLVGHNVSFDLLYLMKAFPADFEAALPHLFIWDTAQVEYLLSGQRNLYPSLDQASIDRGLPVKDDRVKAYWDAGIDTALIPKDLLLDYMKGDVYNTHEVFLDQWAELMSNPNLFMLAKEKMDDIMFTTLSTHYGMKFDLVRAKELVDALDVKIELLTNEILEAGKPHFAEDFDFNPESPMHISLLLYGGKYKVVRNLPSLDAEGKEQWYKGGQKAGQLKTKQTDVVLETKGLGLPTKGVPLSRGLFSTADEFLAKLKHPIVRKIQELREASKDAETYYRGYSALVWPDGIIHPQRNHTSTVTGRLSCSSPNLENVSKDDD